MMKANRIAVAVLAAFAGSSAFAAFGDADDTITDAQPTRGQVTINSEWNNGLWNSAKNAEVEGIIFNSSVKSYVKNAGETLHIGTLTLQSANDGITKGTLEFYPFEANKDDDRNKTIIADKVILENNSALRIMESNDSNTKDSGNGKYLKGTTTLHFGDVTMNNNTAIAFSAGEAHDKHDANATTNAIGMPTAIVIDHISVSGNAGIVRGQQADKDAVVKIGTVDINAGTFDLSGTTVSTAAGAYDKTESNAGHEAVAIAAVAPNSAVQINMKSATSKVIFGHIGDVNANTPTSININFNTAALTGEDSGVFYGKMSTDKEVASIATKEGSSFEVVEGSSIQAVAVDGILKDSTPEKTAQMLADKAFKNKNVKAVAKAKVAPKGIDEGYTYDVNSEGTVVEDSEVVDENTTTHAFSQLAGVSFMQWRSTMNHLQYRMGEIRDQQGQNNGAWVRVYNGKDKYGSQNVENTYYGFQAGYDHRIEGTNVLLGGAVSYTRGDSDFDFGEGDNYNYDFTAYGTWLADNGLFVDATAKVGRISSDVTMSAASSAGAGTASYDTNAFSVSAELGWRAAITDWAYIEPQGEIMYGRVNRADYTFGSINVSNDAVESTIGRLGIQAGLKCPNKKGGAYVRASVLHDFQGETSTKFSMAGYNPTTISEDMGDTWYELGIGAHYNMTETTYFYADFNYTDGGEVESPWRWSIGVRHAF